MELTSVDEKLDKIIKNQELLFTWIYQLQKDIKASRFAEDYAANLAATFTEIMFLGRNGK